MYKMAALSKVKPHSDAVAKISTGKQNFPFMINP